MRTRSEPMAERHNGAALPDDLALPGPVVLRRRWNLRWMVGGVVLVGLSALVMAGFGPDGEGRVEALALARAVKAGQALAPEDFATVDVAPGAPVAFMAPNRRAALVGTVAPTDLPAGMLVAPDLFASAPRVGSGHALAGIVVSEGALPLTRLAPGAVVLVVETPPEGALAQDGAPAAPSVWPASVFSVAEVEDETGGVATFVSLRLATRAAPSVAAAAAQRRVRLLLVDSLDEVPGDLLYGERFPGAAGTGPAATAPGEEVGP